MSDNVTPFRPEVVGDGSKLEVDDVLSHAIGRLRSVVVVGIADDGRLYCASSEGAPEAHFLMAQGAHFLAANEVVRRS